MKEFIKKNKWIIVVVAAFFATYWISSANDSSTVTTQQPTQPQIQRQIPVAPLTNTNLSNNNYYKNVDGNTVHSPAYSESVPVGASAKCGDGTYSFSQNRRGTCSRHGGVVTWL